METLWTNVLGEQSHLIPRCVIRTPLIPLQCTTASVRGPVATLDATKGPEPLKLTIYETLHDKYDPDALAGFKGVSILLLDYLLLTAMLLVTDLQEWMLVRKAEGGSLDLADTSGQGPSFAPDVPFRSDPKFRKIMYGEPIYSKVANGQRSRRSSSPSPVRARSRSPSRPRTPATPESGMPTFVYPESEASSPGPSRMATLLPSMTDSDDEDDEDDDYDTFSLPDPHRASALAESFHFLPITPTTHNSAEPNYYGDRPPVPPLPLQYAKSFVGRNFSSQPPTPVSGSFVQSCEPPLPPLHHIADLISRPRSSPPFQTVDTTDSTDNGSSIMHGGSTSHHDDTTSHSHSHSHSHSLSRNYPEALEHPRAPSMGRAESIRSYTSTTSRTGAAAKRPLPRPPPVPSVSISGPPVARRVQSSSQLANYPSFPKDTPQQPQLPQQQTRPQRSLPPTPGFDASLAAQPSSPVPSSSSSSQNRDPDYTAANTSFSSNTSTSTSTYLRVTTSHTLTPPGSESSTNNSLLHSRQPPITKASQEDLASYVHLLTVSSPQRDLPPEPLPSTSIFDVPPPAYNTIVFSKNNPAGSAGAAAASEVGAETDSGIDTRGEMDTGMDIGAEAGASGHVHYAHAHGLSQGQELYQHYQQYHSQQPQPIQYQYSRRPTLPDIYDSAVSNSP